MPGRRANERTDEGTTQIGAEVERPSPSLAVRPSVDLFKRPPNERTSGRAGGRTKCEVRSREPIWHTAARRPQTDGRTASLHWWPMRALLPPPRHSRRDQAASVCLPAACLLPAWLFSAALSLTHCMVAPVAAAAVAAADVLPPLHGRPAAVVDTPRRGRPLRQVGRRLRGEERRGQAPFACRQAEAAAAAEAVTSLFIVSCLATAAAAAAADGGRARGQATSASKLAAAAAAVELRRSHARDF